MGDSVRHYTIGQVADLTGMSTQLIRKWELRYQVVRPVRLDNGYRAYSDEDIQMLTAVQHLVSQGFAVTNAISSLQKPVNIDVEHIATGALLHPNEALSGLVLLGEGSDSRGLSSMLEQLLSRHGLDVLLKDILAPFLRRIGELWERGAWSEYQEHIASQVIRDFLIHVRSAFVTKTNAPLVIGSCVPYERHEIPVQMMLTEASKKGWRTVSLGSAPAESAIEEAVQKLNPNMVLLSVMTTEPFDDHPSLLRTLDEMASGTPSCPFYIGGRGIEEKLMQGTVLNGLQYAQTTEMITQFGHPVDMIRMN